MVKVNTIDDLFEDSDLPTTLENIDIQKIKLLVKSGVRDKVIAEVMGLSLKTFRHWLDMNPTYLKYFNEWKEEMDDRVEKALYDRCIGYDYVEQTALKNGAVIEIVRHCPPDVKAAIFWLKNRKKEVWKEERTHNISGEVQMVHVREEETTNRLEQLTQALAIPAESVVVEDAEIIDIGEEDIEFLQ